MILGSSGSLRLPSRTELYTNIRDTTGHLWQIDEIAGEYCGKRSREAAYQFIYRNAWIAIVFGNKTFYIPRRTTPQFVAATVEAFGDAAHTVEYARGGHKSDATE